MSTSYVPVFLWVPTRLVTGEWAWLRRVQRVSHNGPYGSICIHRDYRNDHHAR